MKRLRTTCRAFFILAAIFLVALNFLAYRHAYAMTHYSTGKERTGKPESLTIAQKLTVLLNGVHLPRPQAERSLDSLGLPGQARLIACTNGVQLGAWYAPVQKCSSLVILFHGYGGEKSGLAREAIAFREMGYSVLLVDFRGSGNSSESWTSIGFYEAEDVAEAVRYARSSFAPSRVILYGQSMGAAAILRAVHRCEVRPDAVIAEAVFDTMLHTICNRFRILNLPSFPAAHLLLFWGGLQLGFDGFSHNPAHYASAIKCPILFLHGEADPRAQLEEARQVYAAVPGSKSLHSFAGVGHEPCLARHPEEWKAEVKQFLHNRGHLLP